MNAEKKKNVMRRILLSGGLEIRDLSKGQEPFLYSSGNCGPGYVDIKGRVGWDDVYDPMIELLADKVVEDKIEMDLIVGMMTGGLFPLIASS